MKLVDFVKNALFEVEYVEVPEGQEQTKIEKKDKKKEKADKPIAKKIILPKPHKKEGKIDDNKVENNQNIDNNLNIDVDVDTEKEPIKEEVAPIITDENEIKKDFKVMDDNDFKVDDYPNDISINQPVIDDLEPTPEVIETPTVEERVIYRQEVREHAPYGIDESSKNLVHDYGGKPYEKKEERTGFKPSPIISPIYGVLDKNYKKEDVNGSGIYYDTIPYVEDYLEKTTYTIPVFDGKSVVNGKKELSSYVTTLSIKDYSTANGKNSYLNIGKYFWLVGTDEEDNNLYVSEDGSLLDGSLYETYGIRPVFTFKKNTPIVGGIGTKDDPYVINQGDKTNMINETIKINNDIWRVHYDKDNIVKATLYKYVGGSFIYSDESSEFNLLDRGSAAEYLNNSFLSSLPYNNNLQDMTIYTGEVSGDTSLDFTNIYNNNTIAKIGLLNMFDYHILGVDDYYLSNTTSNRGTMVYVYHDYGILEEVQITEPKAMIVTASFKKDDLIKSNDGYYTVR